MPRWSSWPALHGVHLPEALARGVAAAAERGRRARLVPVPAAVRHRQVGRPDAGRRPPAAAGGRARTSRPRARAGWSSRSTRPATPAGSAGSRRCSSWYSTSAAAAAGQDRRRHRDHRRRQPHEAPAGGPHAGQARGRVRRPQGVIGFGLSNDERRGATADFAPAFRIAGRAGLRLGPARRRAGRPGQRAGLPGRAARRPHRARRLGGRRSGAAAASGGRPDHAGGLPDVQRGARGRGHRARRAAADAARRRRARSRSAPTTRCCSARGWPRSTSWPGRCTDCPTPSWPASPGCRCRARRRRLTCAAGCWPASTPGSPQHPLSPLRLARPPRPARCHPAGPRSSAPTE